MRALKVANAIGVLLMVISASGAVLGRPALGSFPAAPSFATAGFEAAGRSRNGDELKLVAVAPMHRRRLLQGGDEVGPESDGNGMSRDAPAGRPGSTDTPGSENADEMIEQPAMNTAGGGIDPSAVVGAVDADPGTGEPRRGRTDVSGPPSGPGFDTSDTLKDEAATTAAETVDSTTDDPPPERMDGGGEAVAEQEDEMAAGDPESTGAADQPVLPEFTSLGDILDFFVDLEDIQELIPGSSEVTGNPMAIFFGSVSRSSFRPSGSAGGRRLKFYGGRGGYGGFGRRGFGYARRYGRGFYGGRRGFYGGRRGFYGRGFYGRGYGGYGYGRGYWG